MPDFGRMLRVSKKHLCRVCGRDHWCGYSADGRFAVCMRVAEGALKQTRNGGYLHILRDDPDWQTRPRVRAVHVATTADERRPDFGALAAEWATGVDLGELGDFAAELGLSVEDLMRLRIGWSARHRAWSFPMHWPDEHIRGIRLRSWDGRKWSVRGGREGLFVPVGLDFASRLLVCEGPTDTAALLDLGFEAIGRPSATGGARLLAELAKRQGPSGVVIVADVDGNEVGQRGARRLATKLLAYVPTVKIITPPDGTKDAREWLRSGATRNDVVTVIEAALAWEMRVARRRKR